MVEVETDDDGNAVIYRRTTTDEYRVVIPQERFGQIAREMADRMDEKELVDAEAADELRQIKSLLCDDE